MDRWYLGLRVSLLPQVEGRLAPAGKGTVDLLCAEQPGVPGTPLPSRTAQSAPETSASAALQAHCQCSVDLNLCSLNGKSAFFV